MALNIDTAGLASPKVDLKQWINETLRSQAAAGGASVSMDVHVGQLLTRLQLHQQETATSLEDMISQSVVRLPRVAMEVERMGKEARDLSDRLATTAKHAQAVVETAPTDAQTLQQLRKTKEKLNRCAKVLQKAKMLGLQLDELEAAASSRSSGNHGGNAKPNEQHDMESITTSVAEVHESLREVQAVDPGFGTAMESRLRTLEGELQHNVERDCLDLMRRQDTARAPKLLTALRKIHRDEHVIQQYLAHVVQSRKAAILQDLKPVMNANIGGDLSIAFAQHYRNFEKIYSKEAGYLCALHGVSQQPVGGPQNSSSIEAVQSFEAMKALTESLAALSNDAISGMLSTASNDALVSCFLAAVNEVEKSSSTMFDACRKPYERLVTQFTQKEVREISLSMQGAASSTAAGFKKGVECIVVSLQRCSVFFPTETFSPVAHAAADAVKQALRTITNIDAATSSNSSTTMKIQQAFQQYNECVSAMRSLGALTDATSGALVVAAHKHTALTVPLVHAKDEILAFEKECRSQCLDAVCATMIVPFRSVLTDYSRFHLWAVSQDGKPALGGVKGAKSLAAFHAGQVSPTDLIRQFGAQLMELPMTLESVENDLDSAEASDGGDIVQFWLSRVVGEIVALTIQEIRRLIIHPSLPTQHGAVGEEGAIATVVPALEQLVCDLEYLSNVLAAVSEASFESTLGVALQQLQDELERAKAAGGKEGHPCVLAKVVR